MNLVKKMTLALSLLAAGSASFAQTTTADRAADGLLGRRYTELSVALNDFTHVSDHGYSVGASANNPIVPGIIDAGASYSYSWTRGVLRGHANTIGSYATAYVPFKGVKPFVGTALGYEWTSVRFAGSGTQALWGATTGIEIPAGVVTITPRINYADDFETSRTSGQAWTFQVEANHWFNRTSAVFGSIGKSAVRRSPIDSWNYEIGLRSRF